jgi:uncharacterized membrane protein YedE/YeeE
MTLWPWWLSGLALAAVPLLHWFGLRRSLAVSGRYTAIVNRLRLGPTEAVTLTEQQMLEAIRAETASQFGGDAVEASAPTDAAPAAVAAHRPADGAGHHALFLVGLCLGGMVSAVLDGATPVGFTLAGEGFRTLFGTGGPAPMAALALGGLLVGFGTRMSGGCTSGHGLCGVSQFQTGSLAATCAFFGVGIATSFLLGAWL